MAALSSTVPPAASDPGTALQRPGQRSPTPTDSSLTDAVRQAWKDRCSELGDDERRLFEARACDGLDAYLAALRVACQGNKSQTVVIKALDWFSPLFDLIEGLMPAATVAVQAYPNPGSLALGGIVGLLDMVRRLQRYQKLILEKLATMGRMAKRMLEFEQEIYKKEFPAMHAALVAVYGDILSFCKKAVRFLNKDVNFKARVKGFALSPLRTFEAMLGEEVQTYENDLEGLMRVAVDCDRRRLLEIRNNQVSLRDDITISITQLGQQFERRNDIQENIMQRDQALQQQEQRNRSRAERMSWLDWLAPSASNATYELRCREHLFGTGTWLIDSETYQQWRSGGSDLMWIHGKPGCGKSVLGALAVTDLIPEKSPDTALAYIFCRWQDSSTQNPTTIFASLAKQISQQRPEAVLTNELRKMRESERPSQEAIRIVMRSALAQFSQAYVVVDALDECSDEDELAEILLSLLRESQRDPTLPTIKILVISRDTFPLKQAFKSFSNVQPDQGENDEDLKSYVRALFPASARSPKKQQIQDECIARANGMFLWVKLLHKSFTKQALSDIEKLERVRNTFGTLPDIYDRILDDTWREDPDVRANAFLVLTWVIHARRPLPGSAMLEAVAGLAGAEKLKDASPLRHPEHLVTRCANLVYIDKEGNVQLCHESVRDYLENANPDKSAPIAEYYRQKKHAHGRLAEICLTYLLLDDFENGATASPGKLIALGRKYRFLEYAAMTWGWHVQHEKEITETLRELIQRFITSRSRCQLAMQIVTYDPNDESCFWTHEGSNPLHILAMFGLRSMADGFRDPVMLLQADSAGRTPLSYSLLEHQHEMCLWLIQQLHANGKTLQPDQVVTAIHLSAALDWVDVLEELLKDYKSFVDTKLQKVTPLSRACMSGARKAAKLLVEWSPDVNMRDDNGNIALIYAIFAEQTRIVQLLLDKGADPNYINGDGCAPLYFAVTSKNKLKMVEVLLEKKANPHAKTAKSDFYTPVHKAIEIGALEIVQTLLCNNLQDTRTSEGYTAMHRAALFNQWKIAQELIRLGLSISEKDLDGETPLSRAAAQGAFETVKVLLEAGCDPTDADAAGSTAIHNGARSGKLPVLMAILNTKPSTQWKSFANQPNTAGNQHTPLHEAIMSGSEEVVKFLLEIGANPEANGALGSSPLHYAAHNGCRAIARMILEYTKNPNPLNEHGDTPLHFAVREGRFDFVKQFFEDCAQLGLEVEVDVQNEPFKSTALMIALDDGSEEIATLLLDKNAATLPDSIGGHPIHQAAWYGYEAIVDRLLDSEGTNASGRLGRTSLHCAAIRGHFKIVKRLLSLSKESLEARDNEGSTPVCAALLSGQVEIANYLLGKGAKADVLNKRGNSLLHLAANLGDMELTHRLLEMGCSGSMPNQYGETAMHLAAMSDNIKVVERLLRARYDCVTPSLFGRLPICDAAYNGNLLMLCQLGALSTLDVRDSLGQNLAYNAASAGQHEVLTYLQGRVSLREPDIWGNTPLMAAAGMGYFDIVRTLVQDNEDFNVYNNALDRETPLIRAAAKGLPTTIAVLLAAGADPYIRDGFGLSSVDHATRHRGALRIMNAYKHFQPPQQDRRLALHQMIRSCCSTLAKPPTNITQSFHHLLCKINLARALRDLEDYEAVKLCCIDIYWSENTYQTSVPYECARCRIECFSGDKYICKKCYRLTEICSSCHNDLDAVDSSQALIDLLILEQSIDPVRAIIPRNLHVQTATLILNYFQAQTIWIAEKIAAYEAWDLKYNSGGKYRALPKPGLEILMVISKAWKIMSGVFCNGIITSESMKVVQELNRKYSIQDRKHRPNQDRHMFLCEDHEFLCVSENEAQTAREGKYLTESGEINNDFLDMLMKRYCWEEPGGDPYADMRKRTKGFDGNAPKPDVVRPLSVRSATTSHEGIPKASPCPLAKAKEFESLPLGEIHKLSRRTQTLPIKLEGYSKSLDIKDYDARYHVSLQEHFGLWDATVTTRSGETETMDNAHEHAGVAENERGQDTMASGRVIDDARTPPLTEQTVGDPAANPASNTAADLAEEHQPRTEALRVEVTVESNTAVPSESTESEHSNQRDAARRNTNAPVQMVIDGDDDGDAGRLSLGTDLASSLDQIEYNQSEKLEGLDSIEAANMLVLVEGSTNQHSLRILRTALRLTEKMSTGFIKQWYRSKEAELETVQDGASSDDESHKDSIKIEDDEETALDLYSDSDV